MLPQLGGGNSPAMIPAAPKPKGARTNGATTGNKTTPAAAPATAPRTENGLAKCSEVIEHRLN